MATPSAIPINAPRDTVTRCHRITRGNRSLWYQMTVLQQPERARACGSGMKANSDRRPVDPPPVVELRIIEGDSLETGKDITFDYNANFFLYASLEHARPLAHGRVQTPGATNPPILTGVPASGMAYLDRPAEAGYFIFPDLSVRHEGRYRLRFSLFETTKEEKDFDREPSAQDVPPGVYFRMDIKTQPFSVFSAKKFPGLMESTQLSKTVADQGCRVRIRRDVRMRKRDGKGGSGFDRREEGYSRQRTVTPAAEDPHSIRARSHSNSSEHRAPYPEPQRRPSIVESYPHPPPPPPPYEPSSTGSRHLSFGDPSAAQYSAPRQYAPQPPQLTPISTNGPYTPSSQSPYGKPDGYGFPSRNLPTSCPSPVPIKQEAYDRRPSNSHYVPPSPSVYSNDGHSRRDSQHSYPPTPMSAQPPRSLPQIKPQPPTQHQVPSQHQLPPLRMPSSMISSTCLPPIEVGNDPLGESAGAFAGGKRKHESVFSQSTRPLFNGQRQIDPHYSAGRRGLSPEPDQGIYARADGQMNSVRFNQWV